MLRPLFTCMLVLLLWPGSSLAFQFLHASDTGDVVHWEALVIPYRVASDPQDVDPQDAADAVREAADAWESIKCHTLLFEDQGEPTTSGPGIDGENAVHWIHSDWPGSPAEVAVTEVTWSTTTGRIADADLLVNDADFTFSLADNPANGLTPLLPVLIHEWGHVIGLDHSDVPGATMTEVVFDELDSIASLEHDDTAGACALYEPRALVASNDSSSGILAPIPHPSAPRPLLPFLWLALGLAGLSILRRVGARPALAACGLVWMCCATPPGADLDGGSQEGDGSGDVAFEDAEPNDAQPSTLDANADGLEAVDTDSGAPTTPVDVAATLLRHPTWRLVRWISEDQVEEGDSVITDFNLSSARSVLFHFQPDGKLRRLVGPNHDLDKECQIAGTWDADGSKWTWEWQTTPIHCPGEAPVQRDIFEVTSPDEGATIVLHRTASDWSIGEDGATLRPFQIVLEPAPLDAALDPCPELAEPTGAPCTDGG